MNSCLSHSFSTANNPQLKNKDKPLSKPPSLSFRKLNKYSTLLLVVIFCLLPIALSRYFQVSSQYELSLQETSFSEPNLLSEPLIHESHFPIQKPISDPNEYRYITLPNGLKVLMISTPAIQRSYTALVLEAGSFIDPPEIPGLSHLLEHVVSVGSKTYSKEIAGKRVTRGAWITLHETVYYYDGKSSEFERNLEMFADSFINPRFDSEWHEPEIHRIDQEYNERIGRSDLRLFTLLQYLIDQESLFARNIGGNYETLHKTPIQKGINVSQALQELFEKHYSANLMTLTILDHKPLDEIQRILTQSKLSKIPNKNLTKPNLDHFPLPLSDKNRHKILRYTDFDNGSQATMAFQVCGVQSKLGAVNFIIDILKRNHLGSLSGELLKRDLIYRGIYPRYFALNEDCGIFYIALELGWAGRYKFEDIVQIVFAYIHKLTHEGLTQDLSNEYLNMKNYLFQYSEFSFRAPLKNSQIKDFFEGLLKYTKEDILRPFELSDDAPTILLAQAKSILLQMNTYNLMLVRPVKNQNQGSDFDESKIYDPVAKMEYSIKTLPENLLKKWNTTTGENYPTFKFLRENPFVPKNFDLIKKESSHYPVKKISNNIWYGVPSNLKIPKVALYLKFPGLNSLEDLLFFKLLDLNLDLKYLKTNTLTMNQINEAGNSLVLTDRHLKINAFSDRLAQILDTISPIRNRSADFLLDSPDEWTLDNLFAYHYRSGPLLEALDLLYEILFHHRCTSAAEIKKNIAHRFSEFLNSSDREMLNSLFANPEFFVYGNISPQDAITMVDKLTAKIPKSREPAASVQKLLNISKYNLVYRVNFTTLLPEEVFVLNYYQGALVNLKNLYYQRIFMYTLIEFVRNSSMNKDIQFTINSFIRGDEIGFFISGLRYQGLYDQNQIDMLLENIISDFYKASKTFSQETIEKAVQELPPSFTKFASFSEQAEGIFSWIDSQVYNEIGSEEFWEILEAREKIDVKEYLEYVDTFFANCGKISLQGFSQKDFSKEPLLQEKDGLIVSKQPVGLNSTDELHAIFASQIKKNIIFS